MGKREKGEDARAEDIGGINDLLQVLHIALKTVKVRGTGTQIKLVKEKKEMQTYLIEVKIVRNIIEENFKS